MNTKDLSADSALGAHINDGSTKFAQSGSLLQNNSNKSYEDIGNNSLAKVDVQTSRPCAIIGPDRVLPSPNSNDGYTKKPSVEPWLCPDGIFRQPPDYPHKMPDYQPTRNISPRQTFQENMQRIMVSPYNSMKISDNPNFSVERNVSMLKNAKRNFPLETKFCEVPYTVNPVCNNEKSVRSADISVSNVASTVTRSAPIGWLPNNVNIRPLRPFGAPEIYQYPDFSSCAGPRPMPMIRPHRTIHDEPGRIYPERFYQDPNIRFRPYPPTKERYAHARYDYINNYPNSFHPHSPFPPHTIDSQKPIPTHTYPLYPQVPIKYIDRRLAEPMMDGYQRSSPQANLNVTYRNPIIHPSFTPLQENCVQNNMFSYPSHNLSKSVTSNKLPHGNKMYVDYETAENKKNNLSETVYSNEINHLHSIKGELVYPNCQPVNISAMPQHPLYRKENILMKNFEYIPHSRNLNPTVNFHNPLLRHSHFMPNTIPISPSDSIASNDTTQMHGITQDDSGYVSQSSSTSVRSIDSHISGTSNDHQTFRLSDYRYGFLPRNIPTQNPNNRSSKVNKDLNVRQFLQMWNEGDDESCEQNKEESTRDPNNFNGLPSQYDNTNKQEQLYVLGSVNVPSEELGKYDHIQKISKLPENIKGYNNIELLNQFEEAIESTTAKNFNLKSHRECNVAVKSNMSKPLIDSFPRPLSPLDVEAKISQSVIHKEVGCNFEIKPCSPKMLNVEIATPIKNVLEERIIEKVSNPIVTQPIILQKADKTDVDNSNNSHAPLYGNSTERDGKVPNCSMENIKYINGTSPDPLKGNYTLQDLVYNSSVCLASLPRLDNDIELNFPEINQQFINANKIESVASMPSKDLPLLDTDHEIDINITKNKTDRFSETPHTPSNLESDKEFIKLSQYRKVKKPDLELKKEIKQSLNKSISYKRTDSVIIKNPDLMKNQENEDNSSISCQTDSKDCLDVEENNICSVNFIKEKINMATLEPLCINSALEKSPNTSVDIAIDFSLNKNNNELLIACSTPKENESLLNLIQEDLNFSETCKKNEFSTISIETKPMDVNNTEKPDDNDNVTVVSSGKLSNDFNQESFKPCEELQLSYSNINSIKKEVSDLNPLQKDLLPNQNHLNNDVINQSNSMYNDSNSHSPVRAVSEYISHEFTKNVNSNTCQQSENQENKKICNKFYIDKTDTLIEQNGDSLTIDNNNKNNILDNKQQIADENITEFDKECLRTSKLMLTELNTICKNSQNSHKTELEHRVDANVTEMDKEDPPKISLLPKDLHDINSVVKETACNTCINKIGFQFNKRLYSSTIQNLLELNVNMSLRDDIQESGSKKERHFAEDRNSDKSRINEDSAMHLQNDKIKDLGLFVSAPIYKCTEQNLSRIVNVDEFISSNGNGKCPDDLDDDSELANLNLNSMKEETNCDDFGKTIDLNSKMIDIPTKNNIDTIPQVSDLIELESNKCSLRISVDEKSFSKNTQSSELSECEENESNYNLIKEKETNNEIIRTPELTFTNHQIRLKRCLSDSALNIYSKDDLNPASFDGMSSIPKKRKKINPCEIVEPNLITEDLCKVIHTNRRNSVSTVYNEENVSFCILIDNSCVITEEYEEEWHKICLAELPEESESDFKGMFKTDNKIYDDELSVSSICENEIKIQDENFANGFVTSFNIDEHTNEKTFVDTWIEDVACVETVFSDDIVEDVITDMPKDNNITECEISLKSESVCYNDKKHLDNIKCIYGNEMCLDDAQLVETLYRTPQMDVRKTLSRRESQYSDENNRYYDNDSLEKILSESNDQDELTSNTDYSKLISDISCSNTIKSKNINEEREKDNLKFELPLLNAEDNENIIHESTQFDRVDSCESTCDHTNSYKLKSESPGYYNFSSPEVSSTTSEEKNCGILLKITKCNGSISSQINEFDTKCTNKLSSKMIKEENDLIHLASNVSKKRPLITKAAQKYIPPIKETLYNLKVKLPLPQHRLNKLKILKISKDTRKHNTSQIQNSLIPYFPRKKSKPKFEDVLKSIDEIQIKMHKEKNKKLKHGIPKVVIKKNENGAHYASTSHDKDSFNPDLTGRKWQPWVFIEKNDFVDKMALNKKIKAVYNHRKNTYVLAEKFRKYKSIRDAKFVISQPKIDDTSSSGKLKYTIRLKHNY